jgi:hypothetical protein
MSFRAVPPVPLLEPVGVTSGNGKDRLHKDSEFEEC